MKTNMNTEQIREEGIQSMKQRTINITRNIICALGILALIILIKPTKVFAFSMNDAKNSPVLTWGQYRTARLSNAYDVKLFQVKVTNRGYFRITFKLDDSANTDNIGYGWDLNIYDKNNLSEPIIKETEITGTRTTKKLVLAKGTYYIEVTGNSSFGADPTAPFNIKADVVSGNSWEQENNNTFGRANVISIGKKYQGTLFEDEDEDWFKVTATGTGKITATLKCDSDTDMDDIGHGWEMKVYSAKNMDEALVRKDEIKTAGSISFNVKKGTTYYIHIEMSSYFGTPVGCVYHLSTSFAGQKTTSANKNTTTVNKTVKMVIGVSLKAKKKKLNVRFKTVANAAKYQIMYSTKKSFKGSKVVTVKTGNGTLKKLKSKKTYFVKVRDISKNGKAGAWITVKKARVK